MGVWSHNFSSYVHVFDGEALSAEEAPKRIRNAVPKSRLNKTMWSIRIFESWKNERANDNGSSEFGKFGLDVSAVKDLKTDMLNMTADTLNFWLCKFVQKVRDKHGKHIQRRLFIS